MGVLVLTNYQWFTDWNLETRKYIGLPTARKCVLAVEPGRRGVRFQFAGSTESHRQLLGPLKICQN
ncbi:MAG: hypothetical protein CMJ77_19580 [Planctomycetaceae bacterium]|nr:hypothetical protein [Planctomycetaceae bacterium]